MDENFVESLTHLSNFEDDELELFERNSNVDDLEEEENLSIDDYLSTLRTNYKNLNNS